LPQLSNVRPSTDGGEDAAFDALATRQDKSIRYQQNLTHRNIALAVLNQGRWRLVRRRLEAVAAAVDAATPGSSAEVEIPIE
jgi:hypothetical protein